MKVVDQSIKLLSITPNPIAHIERCGRVCYKSESKTTCDCQDGQCPDCLERSNRFIKGLIKRGHESVLEHASATMLLVTDRGITHELVRHRIASFSQESTRYCNYMSGDEITVVNQEGLKPGATQLSWRVACETAERTYMELIREGNPPEWARSVLPTCLKSELIISANLRQWRHIISMRFLNKFGRSHPQVMSLFSMVLDRFLETDASLIFEDLK